MGVAGQGVVEAAGEVGGESPPERRVPGFICEGANRRRVWVIHFSPVPLPDPCRFRFLAEPSVPTFSEVRVWLVHIGGPIPNFHSHVPPTCRSEGHVVEAGDVADVRETDGGCRQRLGEGGGARLRFTLVVLAQRRELWTRGKAER